MKKNYLILSILITFALLFLSVNEAQAKRLGGGSSFGSRPSYSQPYQAPSGANNFSQPSHSPSQTAANSQNQTARQNFANRGGLMGLMGGLALGGILGSLFFGGAFEHINFIDFLLLAGIVYLFYRLISAKTVAQNQAVTNTTYSKNNYQASASGLNQAENSLARFNTDLLFKKNQQPITANIPSGFDQQKFLQGAERAYRHLQAAWDNRDLASIRGLTTDTVFAEIQDQIRASDEINKTELLQLHAELLDVREVGNYLEAAVVFDALMRENNDPEHKVREVWHFIKPIHSQQLKWFLDGIQQVEN